MVEVSDFIEGTYFGIISGAIIGLIVGMNSGTGSKVAIIVSILTAISDTLSDAFGMYMSKKAGNLEDNSSKPLKEAIGVLASKFIISMTFLIPFVCLSSLSASSILYRMGIYYYYSGSSLSHKIKKREFNEKSHKVYIHYNCSCGFNPLYRRMYFNKQ